MKPFYGVDITNDKKNEKINSEEFITATVDKTLEAACSKEVDEFYDKSAKADPLWLNLVKTLSGGFGFYIIAMLLVKGLEEGFSYIFGGDLVWMFIIGVALLVCFAVSHFILKKRKETVFGDESEEEAEAEMNKHLDYLHTSMGVPDYAEDVDVLIFTYKIENGEPIPGGVDLEMPMDFKAYDDSGALHLSNGAAVYSFNKNDMRSIRTVEKEIGLISWNKKVEPTDARYAKYITPSKKYSKGMIDKYHILEVERDGEITGIYFPSYELPTFERLTGVTAKR